MRFKRYAVWAVVLGLLSGVTGQGAAFDTKKSDKFRTAAFFRVKNEIKTIEAALNSIDGVFDHIVIIHSNEPDDGSVAVMQKWCAARLICEIHAYPHVVFPSHDSRYQSGDYRLENTLAAYYEFGLSFFEPDEWVMKLDGDQVYLTDQLKKTIAYVKEHHETEENTRFGMRGYNTYPYRGRLVKYKISHNGGGDAFFMRRDKIKGFSQNRFYETLNTVNGLKTRILPGLHWFHFMKTLKMQGVTRPTDDALEEERLPLSDAEWTLYKELILPLLEKARSPYADLKR